MPSNILLVGCGNIGTRHLQSLVKSSHMFSITVIEPDFHSQNIAKSSLDDIQNFVGTITWLSSISELKQIFDLVIIATNAENRKSIIDSLLELGNKRFLIEKMVCQSKQDYEAIIQNLNQNNATGWVNTNRRYFPIYQKLKNKIDSNQNISISVTTGNKGLGSNAIHFIDLFLWFTNSKTVSLNGEFLTDKLYANKRGKQFYEFSGTVLGKISKSVLRISFLTIENLPLILDIRTDNFHILIDETHERILKFRNLEDLESSFKYLHVSDLTSIISMDILKNDSCCLPKIEDLYSAHSELFHIFNMHIKKLTNKESMTCPIT